MTAWLVTGGAGYIGAHVVSALLEAGFEAVAYDNLSTGKRRFVPGGARLVEADILDTDAVTAALRTHGCVGVIHCAGYKYAGESVKYPTHTYLQNVSGTATLLEAMAAAGTRNLVFSSSAGVYGTPDTEVVTEDTECRPESPYGESKLVAEWLIRDQVTATASSDAPLAATSLRYFNVVGSGPSQVYDVSPHNLFPKVFATLMRGEPARINGDDYATPDGTCVRDYVHVVDLANAHVEAARALDEGRPLEPVYNLGSGAGTSVREIVDAMRDVTGIATEPLVGPRRPGDPARIVAAGDLAARDLAWETRFTIHSMVRTAWEAMPRG
ncbi:UDP-glucose 4-epimerase GalE [Demequina sp.]|uniref:UDP-glucose 4-epimerase GalE n=1 Tax=Demequina sp. TaxID=2050685 RepID=UPI0025C5158C|nr:UDP-glucose 4-epimerase GalE [Demequina sp.]